MRTRNRIAWIGSAALLTAVLLATIGFALLHEQDEADTTAGSRLLRIGLFALVIVVLAGAFVRVLVARVLDRPLRALSDGMRHLEEADLHFRLEPGGNEELALVADTFNRTASKLEATLAELRETRDYFEGIVESSADIIITVNPGGYIYTFNRGAEELLGFSRTEMIGRHVEVLFSDPSERAVAIERLGRADNVLNYETHLLARDGEIRDVLLTLTRLRDPEGRTIGTFGIGKDVTDTNRLQKKLVQSERFAAIGQALAGLQHSLKNMLNAMKGGSYMVRLGLKKDDRALFAEGWEMVEGGIENLTSMSSHMLAYVKEWKPVLEPVDLAEMVREIEGIFRRTAEEKGVGLTVSLPETIPEVHCDRRLVHSAVMDILSNALDACVEKAYPEEEAPCIHVAASPSDAGDRLVLAVRDNGCGMTPEVKANVFTPLFSTKSRWGTGLGLAITARTIRLHGGEIEVESTVNVGSEFRIYLPVDGPAREKEMIHGEEGAGRR